MLLFLGAGASKPFGIPTMQDFLKIFDKKIGDSPIYQALKLSFKTDCDLEVLMTVIEDLTKSSEEFFRTISPQTSYFLFHQEHEAAKRYIHEENGKNKAKELLDRIKTIIREECIKAISEDSRILEVYDDFFNSLTTERNKMDSKRPWGATQVTNSKNDIPSDFRIFTTNYDTCMEVYFNRKELEFSRGIVNKYGETLFDVDSYETPSNTNIRIFKLHGSVDLFEEKGKIRKLNVAGAKKTFLGHEYGKESMRWPIEFGGYRHIIESPYLDLFRKLRDAATRNKWWIVIGFSFRDRTICSLLNNVLTLKSKRDRPTILLLDNHPEIIIKRLENWDYPALAKTIQPVEVQFGGQDLHKKLHEVFVTKGYIKEPLVSTSKVPY